MASEAIKTMIQEIIQEHSGETFEFDEEIWSPGMGINRPDGHDFDSLDHVELMMALEEHFDIEIPDAVASTLTTINAAADYVESKRQ